MAITTLRTMRHAVASLLVAAFSGAEAPAQEVEAKRYWVEFRDRGPHSSALHTQLASSYGITERSLWRRSKVLPHDGLIDELDLPVHQSYIDRITSTGSRVRSLSRWLNAVSVEMGPSQREIVAALPFVSRITPVAIYTKRRPEEAHKSDLQPLLKRSSTPIDYGFSLAQLTSINVVEVHKRGINGSGVIIGMIDDGFNQLREHPALKNIRILAEYDFIQRDSSTTRAPGEYSRQGNHGAATLSAVGGYDEGRLVGAAYGASFILAKTEIDSVEIQLEEDLYVEALEWMERLGADIVSTSLGYIDWYDYEDLDGRTATTSKAASIAARKGVLLVTAIGNEGTYRDARTQTTGTLIAPADADSIVAVGAVWSDGRLASFSSTGPTADGRIKPEVVAPGVSVYSVYGELGYRYLNGTSLSTPLAAGVAALILSTNLSLKPMEVRELMLMTARAIDDGSSLTRSHPNNFYGYGMLDALKAVTRASGSFVPERFALRGNYPNPFNSGTTIVVDAPEVVDVELAIFDLLGRSVRMLYRGKVVLGENHFIWRDALDQTGVKVPSGVYIARLQTPNAILTHKMLHLR